MSEAREIELGPIAAPGRRPRPRRRSAPTTPRRCCATPTSAAPAASRSPPTRRQQLAWMRRRLDPPAHRRRDLPVHQRVRSRADREEDRLERRRRSTSASRPAVITQGKDGAVVGHQGRGPDRGPRRPARCARPTPPASATPSGPASSPDSPGGWTTRRCAEVGSMLATYVIETVGTQEYDLGRARFLDPPRRGLRRRVGRRGRGAPHLPAPLSRWAACRSSPPRRPGASTLDQVAPGEDLVGVGADLEPGTLLAAYRGGLFPMGRGRPTAARRWAGGHRTRAASCCRAGAAGQPLAAAHPPHVRDPGRHRLRAGRRGVRRPEPRRPLDHPRDRPCLRRLHRLGWAHSVETWRDGELVGGLYGAGDRRPVRRRVDVPPRDRRLQGGAGRRSPRSSSPTATPGG